MIGAAKSKDGRQSDERMERGRLALLSIWPMYQRSTPSADLLPTDLIETVAIIECETLELSRSTYGVNVWSG